MIKVGKDSTLNGTEHAWFVGDARFNLLIKVLRWKGEKGDDSG